MDVLVEEFNRLLGDFNKILDEMLERERDIIANSNGKKSNNNG